MKHFRKTARGRRITNLLALTGLIPLISLGYQNCSNPASSSRSSSASAVNGEGYGGVVARFYQFDKTNPCAQSDVDGKALPNGAIFNDGQLKIVRSACADITPQVLPSNQYAQDPVSGDLTYQGSVFNAVAPSTVIQLAQAACPTGRNQIPNAVRHNLFFDSEQLLSSNWIPHPGITVGLRGSIGGLPLFSVTRSDSGLLDLYRRLSQFPPVAINTTYAFSFLARPTASSGAYVLLYQTNGLDLQVSVPLPSGAATIVRQSSVTNVQVAPVQAIDSQVSLVTIFFASTVPPMSPDLGITPIETTVGAAVDVTDVELVDTADYCVP